MILKYFTLCKKEDKVVDEGQEERPEIELSDINDLFGDDEEIIVDDDDEFKTILKRPNI